MRFVAAVLLFAGIGFAQSTVQATFARVDIDLRGIVGRRVPKGAAVMTVMLCTDSPVPIQFPRERVLQAAPGVHSIPNMLALDLGARAVSGDPKTFLGREGQSLLNLASSGLTAGGIAVRSDGLGWAGLGVGIAGFIIQSLARAAPSIAPYIGSLLPDKVALDAVGCGTFGLVASNAPADAVATVIIPNLPAAMGVMRR